MTFDPNKIAEQYAEYKRREAERREQEATLRLEREARTAEIQAAIAKKCKPRKLRKPQRCIKCGAVIAVGELGKPRTVTTGFGWREGFHRVTVYEHSPSCPSTEGEQ